MLMKYINSILLNKRITWLKAKYYFLIEIIDFQFKYKKLYYFSVLIVNYSIRTIELKNK